MNNEIAISDTPAEGRAIDLASHAVQLLVVCAVALVGNWVATKVSPLEALPGMACLYAMATPALAYAGLALTKNEFTIARKSGWKIVVVAICVMFGTYIGSVVIADLVLRITG